MPLASGGPARPDQVELGTISGVFGIRGEVKLFLHNRDSDWLFAPRTVTLGAPDGSRYEASLRGRSAAGGRVVARIEGVDTPEVAELLVGARILVARAALPDPGESEFYVGDVVGKPAREGGAVVGTITAVHPGEVDVLEIEVGGDAAYVPLLRENVVRIGPEGVELVPGAVLRAEE